MIQSVDTNIITAHIARLEAEAASHRERSTAGQGPLSDPVFVGFWNIAEGGVMALKAVLAEAEARVPDTPAVADHVTRHRGGDVVVPMSGSQVCPTSAVKHSWVFDGDDPYVVCHFCNEMRDAITGRVVRTGVKTWPDLMRRISNRYGVKGTA